MTKITIISGFLGAGKTTFINLLLKYVFSDEKCVLIENEFGDISVDARLLGTTENLTVSEMNAGCICCSLSSQLSTAVREIIRTFSPDRIIMEPSGVARLSDILRTIEQLSGSELLSLEPPMTILGVGKSSSYLKRFRSVLRNQLQYSGIVILRPDLYDTAEKINDIEQKLKSIRTDLTIFHMPWNEETIKHYLIPLITTSSAKISDICQVRGSDLPPVAKGLNYYTIYPQKSFSREQLQQIFLLLEKELPEQLIRIKGFTKNTDNSYWHVEYSLSGCMITPISQIKAERPFLNVIGTNIKYSILQSHFYFSTPRIRL